MGCNTAQLETKQPVFEPRQKRRSPETTQAIPTILQYKNFRGEDYHNFKINSISESDDKIRLDIESRKSNLSVLLRNCDNSRYSFEQNAIVCMIDSAMSSKLDE